MLMVNQTTYHYVMILISKIILCLCYLLLVVIQFYFGYSFSITYFSIFLSTYLFYFMYILGVPFKNIPAITVV